jgi:hypothetical protein
MAALDVDSKVFDVRFVGDVLAMRATFVVARTLVLGLLVSHAACECRPSQHRGTSQRAAEVPSPPSICRPITAMAC